MALLCPFQTVMLGTRDQSVSSPQTANSVFQPQPKSQDSTGKSTRKGEAHLHHNLFESCDPPQSSETLENKTDLSTSNLSETKRPLMELQALVSFLLFVEFLEMIVS